MSSTEFTAISVDDYSSDSDVSDEDFYQIDGYNCLGVVGRGTTGVVVKMQKDGSVYAAKVCNTRKRTLSFLSRTSADPSREAAILLKIDHKHIVKVFKLIEDSDNNRVFMIMEFLSGGTLANCADKRAGFAQLLLGVQYIHAQRLAHRDIKMENVMLNDEGIVKLCDFGQAVFVPPDVAKIPAEGVGTPAYLAPEAAGVDEYDPFTADMWALGVVLFQLEFGRLPFAGLSMRDYMRMVRETEPEYPEDADPGLVKLLRGLLNKDPTERFGFDKVWESEWLEPVRPDVEKKKTKFELFWAKISLDDMRKAIVKVARGKKSKKEAKGTGVTNGVGNALASAMQALRKGTHD